MSYLVVVSAFSLECKWNVPSCQKILIGTMPRHENGSPAGIQISAAIPTDAPKSYSPHASIPHTMARNQSNKMRRRYYTTLACTLLCMCFLWTVPSCCKVNISTRTTMLVEDTDSAAVALLPGELPGGYTGWVRLEHTLAGSFRITSRDPNTAVVGQEWNVTIACQTCHPHNKSAHFYARAYGPAVLAGIIRPKKDSNAAYTVSFLPMDAGVYTVEVVLVSSGAPSWEDFPIVIGRQEPSYEGFLLPNFPLQLYVVDSSVSRIPQRNCTVQDLFSQTTKSAYQKARWVVVDKVSHSSHVLSTNASQKANLQDYRAGRQSLGIFMDYRYSKCVLQSFHHASTRLGEYLHSSSRGNHIYTSFSWAIPS